MEHDAKMSKAKAFWKHVKRGSRKVCWPWLAGVKEKAHPYGRFNWRGKRIPAHRTAYELTFGRIKRGLHVLHDCDNPPCCNPYHLFTGTQLDNVRDCKAKGRLNREKGEKRYNAKLDARAVRFIRRRNTMSVVTLALRFKVSRAAIYNVRGNKRWKHVE